MNIFQLKDSDHMVGFAIAEVVSASVQFGPEGEEPLHDVEITLKNTRALDLKMTSAQLEAFFSLWERAL